MKNTPYIVAMTLAASVSVAHAQDSAFTNQDAAADQVEALEETIQESAERTTLGNGKRKIGWSGSLSALASATSGNTDTFDFGMGARVGYFDGVNGHKVNFASAYGQEDDVTNKNDTQLSYDYTREFGSQAYGYGQIGLSYSEFGAYTEDHFVGFGVGYHVVSSPTTLWSVQTGPGYRVAETANGVRVEEEAWSMASKFSYDVSDTVSLYNDTDIMYSDADTAVVNELGVSVALSNALALRTSLTTEYHSDPEPGFKDTDNKLGMSIVYKFN